MKTETQTPAHGAFSILEILIVVAVLAVLAGLLMPSLAVNKARAERIQCVSNLKQIGLGFRLYANDGEPYPTYRPANAAWNYFQAVGREIGSPKVLLCPDDKARKEPAVDFETTFSTNNFSHPIHRNSSLSFFYGVDAAETLPNMILAGDRNISVNESMLSGPLIIDTNTALRWTPDIHNEAGNLAMADGSVQQMTSQKMRDAIKVSGSTTGLQRFIIP